MPAADAWGEVPVRCRAVAVAVVSGTAAAAKVLLLQRATGSYGGEWCLVTGRIERGERAWEAAVREVREETGITLTALYSVGFCDQFYTAALEVVEVVPVFVGLAEGEAPVTLNEEHTDYRWERLPIAAEAVPFHGHRVALQIIARDFVTRPPAEWRRITSYRARAE